MKDFQASGEASRENIQIMEELGDQCKICLRWITDMNQQVRGYINPPLSPPPPTHKLAPSWR